MNAKTFIKPINEKLYLVTVTFNGIERLKVKVKSMTSGAEYRALVLHSSEASFNQIEEHLCNLQRVSPVLIYLVTVPHNNIECHEAAIKQKGKLANRLDVLQWLLITPKPAMRLSNPQYLESNHQENMIITWDALDLSQGNISLTDNGRCITFQESGLYLIGYSIRLLPDIGGLCSVWIRFRGNKEVCFSSVQATQTTAANQAIVQVNAGDEARVELFAGSIVIDETPHTFMNSTS